MNMIKNDTKVKICAVLVIALLFIILTACNDGKINSDEIHNPGEQVSDWQTALKYLEDGNRRYIENQTIERNTNQSDRTILKDGQNPFAVIVTCSDSRVSPEIYFDQRLGDIFVIRNAGNIADATALGSIEYAVEHLNVPLVVVVGHSSCGAVAGALQGGEYSRNLQTIIDTIIPAIDDSDNLDSAIRSNIDYTAKLIRENETIMTTGAIVISAYYDIETGMVIFY